MKLAESNVHRMILSLVAPMVAATALAGCSATIGPIGAPSKEQAAQLSSYAATAKYPAENNPADLRVAVLTKGDALRLINFTAQPIRNANIWVNGVFVHKIDALEPQGSVSLLKSTFYDQAGHSLADVNSATYRVTIQQGDTLSTTLGPVAE